MIGLSFLCNGDPVNFFDPDGRQDDEQDPLLSWDFQNRVRAGDPYAIKAVGDEGEVAYVNGDASAYIQGRTERAQAQAAVTIDAIGLAPVGGIPEEAAAETVTFGQLIKAAGRSAVINGGIAGFLAHETNKPVFPAAFGGGVTGVFLGPLGEYAPTLNPGLRFGLNVSGGFAANFFGNSVTQLSEKEFDDYDRNEALFAGLFGAGANPLEANLTAIGEGSLPKELVEKEWFKYASESGMNYVDSFLERELGFQYDSLSIAPFTALYYDPSSTQSQGTKLCPQSQ